MPLTAADYFSMQVTVRAGGALEDSPWNHLRYCASFCANVTRTICVRLLLCDKLISTTNDAWSRLKAKKTTLDMHCRCFAANASAVGRLLKLSTQASTIRRCDTHPDNTVESDLAIAKSLYA